MEKLIVANWKANKNIVEAQDWVSSWKQQEPRPHYQYVVCPAYPLLPFVLDLIEQDVQLGVQDLSAYPAGAYTGEINGLHLNQLGVRFSILGHSERRRYLRETSQDIAKKVEQALDSNITPIVCIDKDQIDEQADLIPDQQKSKIVVAYEPVHAISTFGGQEDPLPTTLQVVSQIKDVFGVNVPVLYGGSVNPENSLPYLQEESIAGVLVGSASLEAATFSKL